MKYISFGRDISLSQIFIPTIISTIIYPKWIYFQSFASFDSFQSAVNSRCAGIASTIQLDDIIISSSISQIRRLPILFEIGEKSIYDYNYEIQSFTYHLSPISPICSLFQLANNSKRK